jgi:predicted DNA-binding transcriptional regulator YafY
MPSRYDKSIRQLSTTEALAMRLVEMQLKNQFPNSMLVGLKGIFANAQKCLDKMDYANNPTARDWLKKIKVVPPAQALLAPALKPEIQEEVYDALLKNRQIKGTYRKPDGNARMRTLNPLALILRGPVTYLVATESRNGVRKFYALHRFLDVESQLKPAEVPDNFDLDAALKKGISDFVVTDEPIQLELRCTDGKAKFLDETKLSEDQQISDCDREGWKRLTATVNDTDQLRRWILGQSEGLEVVSPVTLRNEIKETLYEAYRFYD